MTTTTKLCALALGASTLFASTASAQSGETVMLEMFGGRGWEVSCEMAQSDGDRINTRDRGRGRIDNGRFAVTDVVSANCSYTVPAEGRLQLTLDTQRGALDCPFVEDSAGFCRAQFAAGTSGAFSIQTTSGASHLYTGS
ncbi:hypothetical protein RMQ97_14330 [Maricaulis sp. D1M11]|uniref:hypothetical protein n=1 Tax=Maricaulis sp. D1M11 TaxID=3076117 RepID=UPI0039B5982B